MPLAHGPAAFLAGDWGTTSLRLWACSRQGDVLAERRSDEGMSRLAPGQFEATLRRHVDAMRQALGGAPDPLPTVLCGMAGARQGWREAGYVDLPAAPALVCARAIVVAAPGLDVRILPGLADRRAGRENVMRGEETQLLGVLHRTPELSGLVCLPGTHSKWVRLASGRAEGFATAMTGELFALLREHSVLRHDVGPGAVDAASDAFARGARRMLAEPERLLAALFDVRASGLLGSLAPAQGADLLSGLLIGAEVAACAGTQGAITLVAGGALASAYARVLSLAGRDVEPVEAESVTLAGLRAAVRILWPGALS